MDNSSGAEMHCCFSGFNCYVHLTTATVTDEDLQIYVEGKTFGSQQVTHI